MSDIAITVTPPGGSPSDITADVVFTEATFSSQFGGVPGQFSVKVRDPDRTYSFVTGSEITLTIDGVAQFGGYVLTVDKGSFAPAADTSDISTYDLRTWTLSGPDYNIIFDKRVWRNTSDYLTHIDLTADTTDGAILRDALANFADLSGFDTSSGIEDIATISGGDLLQQGQPLRGEFQNLSLFGGAVWYINPSKVFVYVPYDDVVKRWGFSDTPNKTPITVSPDAYQNATYPFREVTGTEDASFMANDALVWGGSEFAGASGGTVFSRSSDAMSIADHGRWQTGEAHFGDRLYAVQAQVDARSDVIVNGPPGADATGQEKGLKNPQPQFTFTWFSADVPLLSGVPDHLKAGDILNIELSVFGVTTLLPLRELRVSFPDAFEDDGTHLVQFDGTFGLQLSDPFSLWRYLLIAQQSQTTLTQTFVDNSSGATVYGAIYTGEPSPATDGSTTIFTVPYPYIPGSTEVYLNGLAQRATVDYTESDPSAGEITMTSAPLSTDNLIVSCATTDG